MKNAILVHGKPGKDEYYDPKLPSASNSHWFPWLQKQLMINGIPAHSPEMFNSWQPDYRIWSREFERYDITPDTTLVGHSCGAGFIVQWLSEHKEIRVDKVVLVAPWLGRDKSSDETIGGFFKFDIDPGIVNRVNSIIIFNSDNDNDSIHNAVASIRQAIPSVEYKEFHNHGHFCKSDLGKDDFPELLQAVLDK